MSNDATPPAEPEAAPPSASPAMVAQRVLDHLWPDDTAPQRLGMAVEAITGDSATLTLTVTAEHLNAHGIGHGGITFALADTAMAYATNAANEVTVATGASIDFLAPTHPGDALRATASITNRSGRNTVCDVVVTNGDDVVVALFRGRTRSLGRPILPDD